MTDVRLHTIVGWVLWDLVSSVVFIGFLVLACYADDPVTLPLWLLVFFWVLSTVVLCFVWVLRARWLVLAFEMRRQLAINRRLQQTLDAMRALP